MSFWKFVDGVIKVGDVIAAPIYLGIVGAEHVWKKGKMHPDDFMGIGLVTPNKDGKATLLAGKGKIENNPNWVHVGNGKYRKILDREKFEEYVKRGLDAKVPLNAHREEEFLLPKDWETEK